MENNRYFSPSCGCLSFIQVVNELIKFINEDLDKKYRIIVGSDSEGRGEIDLVNAIVIHRLGLGGRYFWYKTHRQNINSLRQKIYEEVNFSIQTTVELLKLLKKHESTLTKCELEVHVDIGEKGETREMIREVVGMVKGYGFLVKTKPDSFAASNVADRYV
jgi:uncharacterized protein